MAYAHVRSRLRDRGFHDFRQRAALGGHIKVEDHATVSAYSGVHQFSRIGTYAFIGAYTVVAKDVLPFSKTVGNRASLFGANTIGLERRGFGKDRIEAIRSGVPGSAAVELERLAGPRPLEQSDNEDVRTLVEFIRSSERGVIVKRGRDDTT